MNAPAKSKTTAVVQRDEAPTNSSSSLLNIISRASTDPNVDIDKMDRLLQMHERIVASNAKTAFQLALADMQPELPIIGERGAIKNKSGGVQSRYALWEDIVSVISPVLSKHGFAITFRTANADKLVTVTGVLSHREGHREETTLTLPIDVSDFRSLVQSIGSSVSYGKRYTASALLNLRTGEVDDDGAAGGKARPLVSDEQVANIQALMTEVGADRRKFLAFLGVQSLDEIYADRYGDVIKVLEQKRGSK